MSFFTRYILLLLITIFLCTSVLAAFKSTPPLSGIKVLAPKPNTVFKRNKPITITIQTEKPRGPVIEILYAELILSYDLNPRPSQKIVVGVLRKPISSTGKFTYAFVTDKPSYGLDTGNYTIRMLELYNNGNYFSTLFLEHKIPIKVVV
ncbi:hypothetical protein Glove_465g62 [Diversispora epigaea]|uniref:Uncharacterized protein n=1 Tax=Diversispora epigaea TaxID=1348612 RepID=A0A397GSQ5_9GLOM|nr:hypothetical protein Glove_465g62 [Diversispora epigaea]